MGKKSSKAPEPDKQIGEAAKMNAKISADWLNFAKQTYASDSKRQVGLDAMTKQVTSQQLATQKQADAWAKEDRSRYKKVFQPLEDKYVKEASNWDSAERQEAMAAEAKADVLGSAAQAQQSNTRQMAAMGVNPNSGRFAGVDRASDTQTALAAAGAQNNARTTARTQGMAMKADALNIGKGLPSQAAGAAGLGLSAGSSALGNSIANKNASLTGSQIMGQGYQGAMAGYGQQANILNNQHSNELAAWSSQNSSNGQAMGGLFSGIGSMAGMFMQSSKDVKENKQPVEGALEAVNSMPIEEWDYKQGAGDGGRHIGGYAEDFQAATGKGDGKSIPIVDAIGVTMKAVQELDQKIEQLGKGKSVARKPKAKPGVMQA